VDEAVILEDHRSESAEDVIADDGRPWPQGVKAMLEVVHVRQRGVPFGAAGCRRFGAPVSTLQECLQLLVHLVDIHDHPPGRLRR
jgi:hypothetical protein